MNFLIIFMFLSASVLKNSAFSTSQNASFCSYLSSKLLLEGKWERYKYQTYQKKLKKPKEKKEKKISSPKKEGSFLSHRQRKQPPSLGKWNLAPLFSADPYTALFLEGLTSDLLEQLYGHAEFWKEAEKEIPELSHQLTHSFLEKTKKKETLSDLFPRDKQLQKVFYKMLKGSGSYDAQKKEGYPPLRDFFIVSTKDKSLTSFSHAPYLVLKVLFDDKTLETLLSLERQKWEKDHYTHSLTKEELRSLCSQSFLRMKGKRFQDIEPFLLFSHKTSELERLTSENKKNHVHLELPIVKQTN